MFFVFLQFFEELATEVNPEAPSELKDSQGKQVSSILVGGGGGGVTPWP